MKQYKLLEITTQYDQYLRRFYNQHKGIEELSYDELFSVLMEDAFAESDFIHRELNKMGIESTVVFCNNRTLQGKWKHTKDGMSLFDILILQIRDFNPDVILISDMCYFSPDETEAIRSCLGINKTKLVGFHFSSLDGAFRNVAGLYDQIYTGNRVWVQFMKNRGLPAYLLRHAFESSIRNDMSRQKRENKVCFLGSIFLGENAHDNRLYMLHEIVQGGLPCEFYTDIYGSVQEVLSSQNGINKINIIAKIAEKMHRGVFGKNYYETMDQYNICLNRHAFQSDEYGSGNMRMFEATGMGICLLTDYKSENSELFDVTNEIVEYDSLDDMLEKAKWLLNNPQRAEEIALAGQKRTLKEYTYRNKAEHLNEYIQILIE